MSIKFSILEEDGIEFPVPTEKDGKSAILKAGLTYQSITRSDSVSTTSSNYVSVPDMSLSLSTGKYLVFSSIGFSNGSNNTTNGFSLYLDGVLVPNTDRSTPMGTRNVPYNDKIVCEIEVPVGPDLVLDMRWKRSGGTLTSYRRNLTCIKVQE